ncbi:MAG: methyltransferase domain-containing protein [Candidatus Woesearchaeota archaeon]
MKLLVSKSEKIYYIKNTSQDFHCNEGTIRKEQFKKKSGSKILTTTGNEFVLWDASFIDYYAKIKRAPQLIPRKDIGTIITKCGINKQSIVVDAGTGSGGTAFFFASIAKKVYTYEIRQDFFKIAKENLKFFKLKNVVIKNKDVYQGIDEKNVDLVFLDVTEPWKAVQAASNALKSGGFLVSYSPSTSQVSRFVKNVKKSKQFLLLKSVELLERDWEFSGEISRPKFQMLGHSGFLTFARKL